MHADSGNLVQRQLGEVVHGDSARLSLRFLHIGTERPLVGDVGQTYVKYQIFSVDDCERLRVNEANENMHGRSGEENGASLACENGGAARLGQDTAIRFDSRGFGNWGPYRFVVVNARRGNASCGIDDERYSEDNRA